MTDHSSTTRRRLLVTAGGLAAFGLAGCTGAAQQNIQSGGGQSGGGQAPTEVSTEEDEGDHHHDSDEELAAHEKTAEAHHGEADAHAEDDGHGLSGPTDHATVEMISNKTGEHFHPHVSWVEVGGSVEFINQSGAHTATAYHPDNDKPLLMPEGADSFDSGLLTEQGATFEHTFDTEGVYHVYCLPHEALGMIGTVIVGRPDAHGQPALEEIPSEMPDRVTTKIESLNHTVDVALGHTHDDDDGESTETEESQHAEAEADGHHEEEATEEGHHADETEEDGHHEEEATEDGHHADETEEDGHHDE